MNGRNISARLTELPESSHVGKHGLDIHSDDSLSDFLDSINDLLSALALQPEMGLLTISFPRPMADH